MFRKKEELPFCGQTLDTKLVHADRVVKDGSDVAPAIHVSTTYEMDYSTPFVYSRVDTPTSA